MDRDHKGTKGGSRRLPARALHGVDELGLQLVGLQAGPGGNGQACKLRIDDVSVAARKLEAGQLREAREGWLCLPTELRWEE